MKKICIFTWTQVGSNLTDLQTLIQADAWWVSIASVTCFQVLTTLGCPGQGHRQPACTWHFCLGLTSCPFLSGLTSAHSSTVSQLSSTCVSHQSCLGFGGSKSPVWLCIPIPRPRYQPTKGFWFTFPDVAELSSSAAHLSGVRGGLLGRGYVTVSSHYLGTILISTLSFLLLLLAAIWLCHAGDFLEWLLLRTM